MKRLLPAVVISGFVLLCAYGCATTSPEGGGKRIAFTKDAAASCVIVVNMRDATEAEKFAAEELKTHLEKITGTQFQVVDENTNVDIPRKIYLGQTGFAAGNDINHSKLGQEEWAIKTVDGNLILTGGRPRGTIYAVYEFLERFAGCHWLAEDTDIIPRDLDFSVPEIDLQGKPSFWFRIFAAPIQADTRQSMSFLARNKYNHAYLDAKYGFIEREGSPGGCHTFHAYSKDWPEDHPEYFSLNSGGKRLRAVSGVGPGQICLTNPEARKLMYEKLRSFIKADREKAAKGGYPPPKVYDISHNDNNNPCLCPSCSSLKEKEGSHSGVMLDFINDIADRIKPEYPDVLLQTFAYTFTIEPPKNAKPRDNVMIRVCNLGTEFPGDGISEPIRPITDEANARFRSIIDRWAEISKNLSVWDYWVLYMKPFSFPYMDINKVSNDMKYFRRSHASSVLVECETHTTSFYPLKRWLALKLMDNPEQDAKTLIKAFMDGFFGPAADEMTNYLNYLDAKTVSEKGSLSARLPYQYQYLLNEQFYTEAYTMLDRAEKKCAANPLFLKHVRFERVPVDSALLYLWDKLEKTKGKPLAFDKKKTIENYKLGKATLIDTWGDWNRTKQDRLAALDVEVQSLEVSVALPKEFEGKDVVDFIWTDFKEMGHMNHILIDQSAAGGKGMRINDVKDITEYKDRADFHTKKPFTMGVYNRPDKQFAINFEVKDVPTDEKYHLYKLGNYKFAQGSVFWAHWSWFIQINIDKAFDPLSPDNEREVYASIKLTGPSYVPGSKEPDAVWIDRIIAVRPEKLPTTK